MRLPFFNRPSTKNNTPVEDGLTEDPERQRARHRLIGAIFMVTVAVAGLPIIFDSKPKQYNNDIAVQIILHQIKTQKTQKILKKQKKKNQNPISQPLWLKPWTKVKRFYRFWKTENPHLPHTVASSLCKLAHLHRKIA
jgi:DedD protein